MVTRELGAVEPATLDRRDEGQVSGEQRRKYIAEVDPGGAIQLVGGLRGPCQECGGFFSPSVWETHAHRPASISDPEFVDLIAPTLAEWRTTSLPPTTWMSFIEASGFALLDGKMHTRLAFVAMSDEWLAGLGAYVVPLNLILIRIDALTESLWAGIGAFAHELSHVDDPAPDTLAAGVAISCEMAAHRTQALVWEQVPEAMRQLSPADLFPHTVASNAVLEASREHRLHDYVLNNPHYQLQFLGAHLPEY